MDYQPGSTVTADSVAGGEALPDYDLATLRKQYQDFAGTKNDEIKEMRTARHYYHGDQWSAEDAKVLKKRKQPVLTNNIVSRKIDGAIGVIERQRQDPKAYPRTPAQAQGADLATQAVRYVCDINRMDTITAEVSRECAINGLAGVEMYLEQGDHGDPDIGFAPVAADCFFYDPRSFRPDFSDARYMGVAKWTALELAKSMFPEHAEELDSTLSQAGETAGLQQQDRELRWVDSADKRVFIVEHWYMVGEAWQYCIYTGIIELARGPSPFYDEKGKQLCRYLMFSANVDHDGDRYGFIRNMKSPQDEINARRSKALHILNTRRIIASKGAVDDVEKTRTEAARPDGFIEVNPAGDLQFDDSAKAVDLSAQIQFLEMAKTDIENFGPNPALIGQGLEVKSGRAISLLQQSGMAELGPFIIAYRGWKLRLYRAIWSNVQRYWTAERWLRITDDDGIAEFVRINELSMNEWGQPTLQNQLGALDVDIILDEGPDTITVMQDTLDTLMPLAQKGDVPADVLIELMNIPGSVKSKLTEMIAQARAGDPQRKALEDKAAQGEIENTAADTAKKKADALKSFSETATNFRDLVMPPEMAPPAQMQRPPLQ